MTPTAPRQAAEVDPESLVLCSARPVSDSDARDEPTWRHPIERAQGSDEQVVGEKPFRATRVPIVIRWVDATTAVREAERRSAPVRSG